MIFRLRRVVMQYLKNYRRRRLSKNRNTYLKKKKNDKHCHKLMIYTNNQGPEGWIDHIKSYFEAKISYKLFDQVVAAFKINGKKIELNQIKEDSNIQILPPFAGG